MASLLSPRDWSNRILAQHWAGRTLPVVAADVAVRMGVTVSHGTSEGWDPDQRRITVDTSQSWGRQQYVVARALGEWVLNQPQGFVPTGQRNDGTPADAFVRELLLPAGSMKLLVIDHGLTSIEAIAQPFGMGERMALQRLQELGYVRK